MTPIGGAYPRVGFALGEKHANDTLRRDHIGLKGAAHTTPIAMTDDLLAS